MSTALSVYHRSPDPEKLMLSLGGAIAKSKLFGCSSVEQGVVLAMECIARGCPPLALREEYHLYFDQLSKKSDAMLADFNKLGGTHKIVSRTSECAAIELNYYGHATKFSFTWDEAKQEPFVYEGKEKEVVPILLAGNADKLKLKAKYSTPRARGQMLWARVVSDGVRAVCPAACRGVYTPEEVIDAAEADGRVATDPGVIEGEYAVNETTETAEQAPFETAEAVSELVTESKSEPAKPADSGVGNSAHGNDPATEIQVTRIRETIKSLEQSAPGTATKFKELLLASGRQKIADLTILEAEHLLNKLGNKQMLQFFSESLQPKN